MTRCSIAPTHTRRNEVMWERDDYVGRSVIDVIPPRFALLQANLVE